jgi:hypothetical protein
MFGKDEGLSVDDVMGMYEGGFGDSAAEDGYETGHDTGHETYAEMTDSEMRRDRMIAETPDSDRRNDWTIVESPDDETTRDHSVQPGGSLAVPVVAARMTRDSAAMFQSNFYNPPPSPASFSRPQSPINFSRPASPAIYNQSPSTNLAPPQSPSFPRGDALRPPPSPTTLGRQASRTMGVNVNAPYGPLRDRYGFKKVSQHITLAQYEAWNVPYTEFLMRRRKKWVALLRESGMMTDKPMRFPPKSAKVKRFVRKGIPPDWRGAAWFYYAGGPAMVAKHPGLYKELIDRVNRGGVSATDEELIERDLNRTFPDNIKFKPDPPADAIMEDGQLPPPEPETPTLQSLRRVLQAFSVYNPKIGYCQSLNFLAGLLLLFMNEEKSFWMLNIITRVYLPGTHEVNLEGANVDLGVLMMSIKDSMPAIWAKIGGELDGTAGDGKVSMRLPPITLCTTAWFMSCFIGTLPIETTLRVWDSFFYEGSKTLFRIALAIFKVGESEIRAVSDPMEIFQVVQTIPRRLIDASALMEACFKRRNGFGHLSQDTIEDRRAERRQGYADERAKAAGELPLTRKNTRFKRKEKAVVS